MNTDSIQGYMLRSERNVRIAATAAEAWPAAREKLVAGFLTRLQARLSKKLKGWEFEGSDDYYVRGYSAYWFSKPGWEHYWLRLSFEKHGQNMVFGVGRSEDKKQPHCEKLLDAVTQIDSSAFKNGWWEAGIPMKSPAADWSKPEVLWQMHKDKEFLNDVAEQLLKVATVSVPIIDKLVRK